MKKKRIKITTLFWLAVLALGLVEAQSPFRLISPNGGEVFLRAREVQVKWQSHDPAARVALLLYRGGKYLVTIAPSVPDSGSWLWKTDPSLPPGLDFRLRIRSLKNPQLNDFSDRDFEIR